SYSFFSSLFFLSSYSPSYLLRPNLHSHLLLYSYMGQLKICRSPPQFHLLYGFIFLLPFLFFIHL
ncbi:hypothetical protein LINPERHAP2_LOCUS39776, partial [Linum perenne]